MMPRLLLLVALAAQPPAAAVSGLVTDAATKGPVASARVLLARLDGPLTESLAVTTGRDGHFAARAVPPGRYRVFADRDDYLRGEHARAIDVKAGAPIDDVLIALTPTGVISGRVTNEHGEPVPNAVVAASQESVVAAETRTNDLGEFRLFSLPPGAYIVSARRYDRPRIEDRSYVVPTPPCPDCRGEGASRIPLANLLKTGVFVDPAALAGRSSAAVYFPGTTDLTAADPIRVGPGAQVGGIELMLIVKF